jgi:hypothetical protein
MPHVEIKCFEDALNIARAAHSRDFSHELAADKSILNRSPSN